MAGTTKRVIPVVFVALLALGSAGCFFPPKVASADGGGSTFDGGSLPRLDAGAPIETAIDVWTWVPVDGSECVHSMEKLR